MINLSLNSTEKIKYGNLMNVDTKFSLVLKNFLKSSVGLYLFFIHDHNITSFKFNFNGNVILFQ